MPRLLGRAAIVTGGGSGIGRAVCQLFAKEGARVAILDIDKQGMEETMKNLPSKHGNTHCTMYADITSAEMVKEAFHTANKNFGMDITILVNCAGFLHQSAFADEISEKIFDGVLNINLKGTFLMCTEFLRIRRKDDNQKASIVNIASLAGANGYPSFSAYCSSKFGVVGFTKSIATEYSKHKVRCNTVLPGFTRTKMYEGLDPVHKEEYLRANPMQRIAEPEEIANVCLFLASEESSYVNGASLKVTGGTDC